MATNIPVTVNVKANQDASVSKTFGELATLAKAIGKDTQGASKNFDQLAKDVKALSAAVNATAQAMGTLGKQTKEATTAPAAAAKRLGDEMKTAGEKSTKSLKQTADQAHTTVTALREMSDSLQEIGGPAAQGLQGAARGLVSLASQAAATTQQFEVLEAQLKTIKGTQAEAVQAFAGAKDFAVATPFDVKQIVEATVTLEAYGQRSQEVLPEVAALAAGMNKELGATALVVGKAMSGSLEGFESLRNEYGISTRELVKYGAETNKTGGIMVQTAGQVDKARAALSKIIEVRFGEALADRAKTVSGAVSNAGDAIINFAADVGEGVAPFIRFGAVLTQNVFGALQAMPTVMKAGLGATAVLGAGVLGLGAVTITTTLALFRLDLELKKIVASNRAAAAATGVTSTQMGFLTVTSSAASTGANLTSGAITRLGTAATYAGRALTFLTRTPVGIALSAAALVGTAAYAALNNMADAAEEAGRKVADTSKLLTEQTFAARQVTQVLTELGGESIKAALAQDTLGARTAALANAIKGIPAGELTAKLKQMGLGPEEMKKALEATKEQAEATKKELQALLDKRAELGDFAALSGVKVDDKGSIVGPLKAQFEELDQKIFDTTNTLKTLGAVASLFNPVKDAVAETTLRFEEMAKASDRALDFSKYANQVGGIDAARQALEELRAQTEANGKTLASKGYASDKQGILSALQGGVDDETQKKALEKQLDLYEAIERGEKTIADASKDAGKQRIADIEQNLAKEKAIRDVSRGEELTEIDKAINQAKALGKDGLDDEVRLLEQRKAKKAEWAKEDLDIVKNALESQWAASKAFVDKLEAEGAPRGEIVAAYDRMIAKLNEWRDAHGPLLARNKELADQVNQTFAGFVNGRAANATKLIDDNLKALKDSMKAIGDEAETNALKLGESVTQSQKLEVIDRQIDLVKKAQGTSSKEVAEHDKILTDLGQERLALEQAITQTKLRQAGKENQLAIESLRQEIELLQIRKEQGFAVDDQLVAKSAELREARLKDLELTYQAERETAEDKVAVEREYQLARKNLEQEFTIEREREAGKRVDIAKKEATQTKQASSSGAGTQASTGGSSSTQARDTRQAPGDTGPYSSGITFSGFTTGQGRQLRERREEREAARHEAFLRANPLAVQKVADIDRQRAEDRATRETAQRNARGAPAPFGTAKNYDLAPVSDEYKPASASGILKRTEKAKEASAKASGGAAQAGGGSASGSGASGGASSAGQTVNDNRSYHLSATMEGGGFKDISNDPRIKALVVSIFEEKFQQESYRDGGQGSWQ